MATYSAKPAEMEKNRAWVVLDATNQPMGRLAVEAAKILRGKNKPEWTPHVDCGDHVIIINADKVRLTGNSKKDEPIYRHTLYPGGIRINYARTRDRERLRRGHDARRQGHAAAQHSGRADLEEAARLRRPGASASGAEAVLTRNHCNGTNHTLLRHRTSQKRDCQSLAFNGEGNIVVNEKTAGQYFGRRTLEALILQPFEVTETVGPVRCWAKTLGGGISGQAGAMRHGISKALIEADPNYRPSCANWVF